MRSVVRFPRSEWLELRSERNLTRPDIFIKQSLIKAYHILRSDSGYTELLVKWGDSYERTGWVPESFVD